MELLTLTEIIKQCKIKKPDLTIPIPKAKYKINLTRIKQLESPKQLLSTELVKSYTFESPEDQPIENPNEILRKEGITLESLKGLTDDPIVQAAIDIRKSGVLELEWEIEQRESAQSDFEIIQKYFNSTRIYEITNAILDAPLFGYTVFEMIWTEFEGKLFPQLIDIPVSSIGWNFKGDLLYTNGLGQWFPAPDFKFLVIQNSATPTNPFGVSLLSKIYYSLFFKNNAVRLWNINAQKNGLPWVVINYDDMRLPKNYKGTPQDYADEIYEKAIAMAEGSAFVMPKGIDMKLTSPSTRDISVNFKPIVDDARKEIISLLTGNEATINQTPGQLGGNQRDSLASKVNQRIIDTEKRIVETTFNKLIQLIYAVNFNNEDFPKFVFFEESETNKELSERDSNLVTQGVRFDAEYYADKYKIPEGQFKVVDINSTEPATDTDDNLSLSAENAVKTPDYEKNVSLFMDWILDPENSGFDVEEHKKPIFDFIKGTKDLETMLKTYQTIYPKLDKSDLQDIEWRAMNVMDIYGQGTITNEINEDESETI